MVAGQPWEEQAQPVVGLHVELDRAVVRFPAQDAAAVGMPLRGQDQVLAKQAAVLSILAAEERLRDCSQREQPVA